MSLFNDRYAAQREANLEAFVNASIAIAKLSESNIKATCQEMLDDLKLAQTELDEKVK